jgi:hypothetical protein
VLTYYSSDHEIGSTFQVVEQTMKIMLMVVMATVIKCWLRKEGREKQKTQDKGET